jgi:hypothetical protein
LSTAAQSHFEATVSANEATFTFPLNPNEEHEWSSGGLSYQWSVKVTNNRKLYDFGFYLFTPMGASATESGDINKLLEAGQFSAWSSNKVVNNIKVKGYANDNNDKLTIQIADKNSIQLLFSGKPKYVTFSTLSDPFDKPKNQRVTVKYVTQK